MYLPISLLALRLSHLARARKRFKSVANGCKRMLTDVIDRKSNGLFDSIVKEPPRW
jgi:hypothetical protein